MNDWFDVNFNPSVGHYVGYLPKNGQKVMVKYSNGDTNTCIFHSILNYFTFGDSIYPFVTAWKPVMEGA